MFLFIYIFFFLKIILKNTYFKNEFFFIESFWKQYSFSFFKTKNFFLKPEIKRGFYKKDNWLVTNDFLDLHLLTKKKFYFKERKIFLKNLKSKYFKKIEAIFINKKNYNKIISTSLKKFWYSYEFKFVKNWSLKQFIQKNIKKKLLFTNFLKNLLVLNYWKKYQRFFVFNTFNLKKHSKKINKKNYFKFLQVYNRWYKKTLKSDFFKKKIKKYKFRKFKFLKKKKKNVTFNLHFFPRRNNAVVDRLVIFPQKLQLLFSPYGVDLQKNYLNTFNFLINKYSNYPDLIKNNKITYFLKFKKKRSNFYFTIFNNHGEVIYYLSSGKFLKLNFSKRNRKMRNSFFSIALMIKNICKVLKKKKIFRINVFIKPSFLKLYIIRRIFYSFFYNGVKLMSIKNFINLPHNKFTKNKKIRRI